MASDSWAAVPVAPVKVWPFIPQSELVDGIKGRNVHLVQSHVPPADGTIPNVKARGDIRIDLAFDVPEPPDN